MDQKLVNSLHRLLNLIVMLLQQSIEHVSIVYTCTTYFIMHWSMLFFQEFQVNILVQYISDMAKYNRTCFTTTLLKFYIG